MVDRYKEELSKIVLSEEQKQQIMDAMASEYLKEADSSVIKTKSIWSRYSKYIACAACLVILFAAVGITSAANMGFGAKTNAFAMLEGNLEQDESYYDEFDEEFDEESADANPEDFVVESDTEDDEDDDIVIEAPVSDNELTASNSFDTNGQESKSAESDMAENIFEDSTAATGSQYAPENYDGEYFAEDYVFIPTANTTVTVDKVIESSDDEMSYNTLCENISKQYDKVGFVKFEITDILSDDEANTVAGDDEFSLEHTMYKATLIYDYLTNASASGEMYISAYGNELVQISGYPTFATGDTVLALVDPNGDYVKIIDQMVYQIHRVNGVDIAYHILYEGIDPGDTNMGILDMETSVYTTTINNPAHYTSKAAVKELTRYVRRNFTKRDITVADMTDYSITTKSDATDADITDTAGGEIADSDEYTLYADSIVFKIKGIEMQPLGDNGNLSQFKTYSYATTLSDGTKAIKFGNNIVAYEGDDAYSGNVTRIEIHENSIICPFTVNGITVGKSWTDAVSALNADITPQYEEDVTFSVTSENQVIYRMTFCVKHGLVESIIITK